MDIEDKNKQRFMRLKLLYKLKANIYFATMFCGAIFIYSFKDKVDKVYLAIWGLTLLTYLTTRFSLSYFFNANKRSISKNPATYENLYAGISLFGGLIWGSTIFMLQGHSAPEDYILLTGIMTGITAGALASNAPSFRSSLLFTFPILALYAMGMYYSGLEIKYTMISFTAAYLLGVSSCAKYLFDSITRSILLNIQKENLIQQIEKSKNQIIMTERQALEASRLASIGEMASGVAHEINNPLTIINGSLAILKRATKETGDLIIYKNIRRCTENVTRIANIINSLKKMSQPHSISSESDSTVDDIIKNAAGFINEKLKSRNISLKLEINHPFAKVNCNAIEISQILLNLITNSYHNINKDECSWIELSSHENDDYIYFQISDSSHKISKNNLENLNKDLLISENPLDTTNSRLELILSQAIASTNKGDLYYEEIDGKACFTLRIPQKIDENLPIVA